MKIIQLSLALGALALAGCGSKSEPTATAPLTVESAPVANAAPATEPKMDAEANAAEPETDVTESTTANAPTETAATDKPDKYRVRGEVVEVMPAQGDNDAALMVKHEDIPGFMPAMQMRLPLADANDAAKVKPGDKIVFDMNSGNTAVSNIEMLPPSTALKLEK